MANATEVKVATYNCEWRRTASADARLIVERLFEHDPDVICLTECHADYLKSDGYVICSALFDQMRATRRKALLWSREPWSDVRHAETSGLPPGRFVQGTTETALGPLTFLGVVIPYRMAEVRARRRKPWELHYAYLDGLDRILPPSPHSAILLGDFNQRIPRRFQPVPVHDALREIMRRRFLSVASQDVIEPIGRQSIDHICVSNDLEGAEPVSISNIDASGRQISDHFGVCVTVVRAPAPRLSAHAASL